MTNKSVLSVRIEAWVGHVCTTDHIEIIIAYSDLRMLKHYTQCFISRQEYSWVGELFAKFGKRFFVLTIGCFFVYDGNIHSQICERFE